MKALTLDHPGLTRESLLRLADRTPGAWIGIRIAVLLLILAGWKSAHAAELFGLTRWTVVKWIHRANTEGAEAVLDRQRMGRLPCINKEVVKKLEKVLADSPREVGIPRNRWDGNALVKYLKKTYHIKIHIRHAQRIMKKLGHSSKMPVFR
ncbi:MAG: helix-turn-helix domain-containing protein [Syntrophales bacterium]|jgi:transposase